MQSLAPHVVEHDLPHALRDRDVNACEVLPQRRQIVGPHADGKGHHLGLFECSILCRLTYSLGICSVSCSLKAFPLINLSMKSAGTFRFMPPPPRSSHSPQRPGPWPCTPR